MSSLNAILSGVAIAIALTIVYAAIRERSLLGRSAGQLVHDLQIAKTVLYSITRRDEFAEKFEATSAQLDTLEIFGPVWDEFRESLDIDAVDGVVRSARDPYEFLGPRLLDASDVDQRRIEAVPNVLIALGLIFTFVGLILSLLIAGSGLSADSFPEVRAALTALLTAAGFKFVTSIAGIASSIWFTLERSKLLNHIDALSAAIARQLDHLTAPLRADILAEASHRELVHQSNLLERSHEGLAAAIATQLDQTLQANLSNAITVAFRPFVERIDEMGRTIAEMNQDALNNMVKQFSKELGGAAREHSERMEKLLFQVEQTLKEIPAGISKAATAIESAGATFSDVTGAAVAVAEQRLAQSGNIFAEMLAETERNLGSAGLALRQASDLLQGTVARLEQTENAASQRTDRAEETLRLAVEQISRVLERTDSVANALAPMTALAQQLGELGRSMATANESNLAALARSEQVLSGSRTASETLGKTASSFADSTSKLRVDVTALFEQLAAGIDLFRSGVEETLQQLDQESVRIVGRMAAAADGAASGSRGGSRGKK